MTTCQPYALHQKLHGLYNSVEVSFIVLLGGLLDRTYLNRVCFDLYAGILFQQLIWTANWILNL